MQYKIKKNKIYEKTTLSKIIYPKSLRTGPFGSNLKVSDYVKNSNYKVYTQENIICNDINIGDKYIKEKKYNDLKSSKIENGDFLVSTRGTLGRFMYADNIPSEGVIHSSVIKFRVNYDLVEWKFILLQLKYLSICKNFILESTNVGAIPALYTKNILDIPIYLTDIIQQKKIVYILEKQESVISNIEKLISKTEKMFEYFKNELLSGRKIIDFKNMEVNSIDSSNKLDLKTVKLSDIISFSMGNTPKKVDDNYNGDIPWITISNLKSKYINNYTAFVKNSKSIKIIPKDTLIGSFKMSVGRFGFTTEDCCTNEAIIAIRKEDTKENLDYLYYLLPKYFNDNAEKNGQGIPLLNSKKIKDIMVDIPKLEDQNKIVDFLKKYENLIENQKKLLEKEKQKFEWLSEKLLSGEYLVVEEQE